MSNKPLLELKKIVKSFGANRVLSDINFAVNPGEVIALLGDNGAGKSTLIKVMNGFHRQTSGQIYFNNKPVDFDTHKGPEQARSLGIETVHQHLGLIPTLSITRNYYLGRELRSGRWGIPLLDYKGMQQAVAESLKEIGLTRKLHPDMNVSVLSGGERQAISIAKARHFGAKLLILDEPTSALSVGQTQKVLGYIKQAARSGLGVVLITHTLEHVSQVADRVVVLFRGSTVGNFKPGDHDLNRVSQLMATGS